MNMREKYNALKPGERAKIKRLYMASFGVSRTFSRKINGTTRLLNAEKAFFTQHGLI